MKSIRAYKFFREFGNILYRNKNYYYFLIGIGFYWALFFTLSDFISIPCSSFKDYVGNGIQWACVSFVPFLFWVFVSMNKYLFALLFPLFSIVCAVLTYFRYAYKFVLNSMMLYTAFNNDVRITAELISPYLVLFVLINLFISFLFVRYLWKMKIYKKSCLFSFNGFLAFSLFFLMFQGNSPIKRMIEKRIPANLVFTTLDYYKGKTDIAKERERSFDYVKSECDSITVVLVIGESLRPDHLSVNGYFRKTPPNLDTLGVISFPNVNSLYSYTNQALPYLMTRTDTLHTDRAYKERSFIDVFKAGGFHTSWISNQDSEKSYVYFINEADTIFYVNRSHDVYSFDQWLDEDILPYYNRMIDSEYSKKLVILHTIGSHWWYNLHYTKEYEVYKPVLKSKIIAYCTDEEIRNSYDNTILYTDYILSEIIDKLKDKNAVLIFVSDHGEALGDDSFYLHGTSHPTMFRTAMFVWMSEKYKSLHPEHLENALKNKDKSYMTDFVFPSIIDAGCLDTDILVKSKSIFASSE